MDPDTALDDLRAALVAYRSSASVACDAVLPSDYVHACGELQDSADALADAVEALDDWLAQGGFAPRAWRGVR